MSRPLRVTPHTEQVISVLDRHGVQYLLVGGVAALLHGAHRPTFDLDLLPRSDQENLDRLASAEVELGAHLRVGGLSDEEARSLPTVIDGRSLRGMEISTWRTASQRPEVGLLLGDGFPTCEVPGPEWPAARADVEVRGIEERGQSGVREVREETNP